jgi:hypothetical protein
MIYAASGQLPASRDLSCVARLDADSVRSRDRWPWSRRSPAMFAAARNSHSLAPVSGRCSGLEMQSLGGL